VASVRVDEKGSTYGTGNDWVWAPEKKDPDRRRRDTDESRDELHRIWSIAFRCVGSRRPIPCRWSISRRSAGSRSRCCAPLRDLRRPFSVQSRQVDHRQPGGKSGAPGQHRDAHRMASRARSRSFGSRTVISALRMPVFLRRATWVIGKVFTSTCASGGRCSTSIPRTIAVHQGQKESGTPVCSSALRAKAPLRRAPAAARARAHKAGNVTGTGSTPCAHGFRRRSREPEATTTGDMAYGQSIAIVLYLISGISRALRQPPPMGFSAHSCYHWSHPRWCCSC